MWKKKMENKHEKKHSAGSAFLWGFILGAIFASLLTTKKGRAILKELVNTGMELIEDFVEDRKNKAYEKKVEVKNKVEVMQEKEEVDQAVDDLNSEIGEEETVISDMEEEKAPKDAEPYPFDKLSMDAEETQKIETAKPPQKLGSKRRLFKGLRKKSN